MEADQPGEAADPFAPTPPGEPRRKYYIKGRPVQVLTERIEYLDENGKLVIESLRDYSRRTVRQQYASLDAFLRRWRGEARKATIIEELAEEGLLLEPLQQEVGLEIDPFDLICHIAYDQPPLSRRERAARVQKQDVFNRYGPQARAVLEALLAKYQDEGVVGELDNVKMLRIPPFTSMGTPLELVRCFGDKAGFEQAVHELQSALYAEAA
jgi:type I restriction enzyme R subunit